MRSAPPGKLTSDVEVTIISRRGFWMLVLGREYFLPFRDYPWFQDASLGDLLEVTLPHPGHLYWPKLDVDLAVESLDHPERYPLISLSRLGQSGGPPRLRPKPAAIAGVREKRVKYRGRAPRRRSR